MAARRPPRRSLWPLAAVLTVVVLVISAVSRVSDGPDKTVAYLDDIRPSIERANQVGSDLAVLRQEAASLDRAALRRRLAGLSREADDARAAAEEVDPPRPLRTTHGYLMASLAVRARAVADLDVAMRSAIAADQGSPAVTGLLAVGQDLAIGDRSYQLFVDALPKKRRSDVVPSRWVPRAAAWQAEELATFIAALRAAASLQPVHDVAVVLVATDPPAAGKEGDADLLPAVKAIVLDVVVANAGNEPERRVTVEATLSSAAGQADVTRQFVDLASGQRLALRMRGLNPVPLGRSTIVVRVGPVAGEVAVADNQWTKAILVR